VLFADRGAVNGIRSIARGQHHDVDCKYKSTIASAYTSLRLISSYDIHPTTASTLYPRPSHSASHSARSRSLVKSSISTQRNNDFIIPRILALKPRTRKLYVHKILKPSKRHICVGRAEIQKQPLPDTSQKMHNSQGYER